MGRNLAWKIRYELLDAPQGSIGACVHHNFAEGVGQALFAFHQWLQHNMGVKPDQYKVLSVHRLLRGESNGVMYIRGEIEIHDFPRKNPVTPPIHLPAMEDHTQPFDFLAEVPVVKKDNK